MNNNKEYKNMLPPPLPQRGQEVIQLLNDFKKELLEKQSFIIKKNQLIEKKITQLTQKHKSLKINHEQRKIFEQDCNKYLKLLDSIMQEIDKHIEAINQFLHPRESTVKSQDELITFIYHAQATIQQTKKYIKKVQKNIAISHSRFCFSFETQSKQLSYLETKLSQ